MMIFKSRQLQQDDKVTAAFTRLEEQYGRTAVCDSFDPMDVPDHSRATEQSMNEQNGVVRSSVLHDSEIVASQAATSVKFKYASEQN